MTTPRKGPAMTPGFDLPFLSKKLASPEVSMTTLDGGTGVLVNLEGMEILKFNDTGMFVIERLREDATSTMEGIVTGISSRFDVDEVTARDDVGEFLAVLTEAFSKQPRDF